MWAGRELGATTTSNKKLWCSPHCHTPSIHSARHAHPHLAWDILSCRLPNVVDGQTWSLSSQSAASRWTLPAVWRLGVLRPLWKVVLDNIFCRSGGVSRLRTNTAVTWKMGVEIVRVLRKMFGFDVFEVWVMPGCGHPEKCCVLRFKCLV